MIPLKTIEDLIGKHALLEKELSSGKINSNDYAKKSKEYAELGNIIKYAQEYLKFESNLLVFISPIHGSLTLSLRSNLVIFSPIIFSSFM